MTPDSTSLYQILETASFLGHVSLFEHLTPACLADLARIVRPVSLDSGQVLFREGDFSDGFYIIRHGKIAIEIQGRPVTVLDRYECLGELSVLADPGRTATARAVEKSRLVTISSDDFKGLLALNPEISLALMQTLAQRIRDRENGGAC